MSHKSFSKTVFSNYSSVNTSTILLKSSFIDLCSDTDRFFRKTFGVDIYKLVNEDELVAIRRIFPNFQQLTLEQFNRLLYTFTAIRDINAHLFVQRGIILDDDIENFICSIINTSSNKCNESSI